MKEYKISANLLQAIVNILQELPWKNSAKLMEEIMSVIKSQDESK